ncbi:MAG TPA: glycosyl hydrolase family 28-related protein [Streptosporangiaceae bacterium]|nr:glycosyl hydrolase family 28-related protein [Streptosporangiaceae bacterium]
MKGQRRRRFLALLALMPLVAVSSMALTGTASAATLRKATANGKISGSGVATANGKISAPGLVSPSSFTCSATGSSATTVVTPTGLVSGGSVDNTTAIQNAINTAGADSGGGIVSLPAGTFMINGHLVMQSKVKLTGVGPATVLEAGPNFLSTTGTGGGYPIISTAGASNVTIANLTANQSGNTLNGNLSNRLVSYVVEGRSSTNVVINDVSVINPFTYSIAMVTSSDFCIENSNVNASATDGEYNQLDGIHILDSNNGDVINNVIVSGDDGLVAHSMTAPVYNILYANNLVDGGTVASGLQFAVGSPYPIYGITVEDNDFYGSGIGIHTGYYGSDPTGSVHNIAMSNNYIYNILDQVQSIQIGYSGQVGAIKNVTVSNTLLCNAGPVQVQRGSGNSVTGTTTTTSCA